MSSSGLATTAMTSPTGTVSPSWASALRKTPFSNASISTFALSVSISATGSPRSTRSPSAFSQRRRTPSCMSAPIWGMTTSLIMEAASQHGSHGVDHLVLTRQRGLLEVERVRHRDLDAADARHRSVEVIESQLLELCRYLGAKPARAPGVLDHDRAVRLLYRLDQGFRIERTQRAQVDDFGVDAILR